MPKFLIEASLTSQGVKGVQNEGGTARRETVSKAVDSVGGHLESFHFGFGDHDVFVIADFPDNESATAMALALNASGAVTTRTVVLQRPRRSTTQRSAQSSIERPAREPRRACAAVQELALATWRSLPSAAG
jgi:uncharacterized protein with GYD domain